PRFSATARMRTARLSPAGSTLPPPQTGPRKSRSLYWLPRASLAAALLRVVPVGRTVCAVTIRLSLCILRCRHLARMLPAALIGVLVGVLPFHFALYRDGSRLQVQGRFESIREFSHEL